MAAEGRASMLRGPVMLTGAQEHSDVTQARKKLPGTHQGKTLLEGGTLPPTLNQPHSHRVWRTGQDRKGVCPLP
jgi:hypothetical protein